MLIISQAKEKICTCIAFYKRCAQKTLTGLYCWHDTLPYMRECQVPTNLFLKTSNLQFMKEVLHKEYLNVPLDIPYFLVKKAVRQCWLPSCGANDDRWLPAVNFCLLHSRLHIPRLSNILPNEAAIVSPASPVLAPESSTSYR